MGAFAPPTSPRLDLEIDEKVGEISKAR